MKKNKDTKRTTYYVVLRGRSPGVYAEKRQAQAQVRGMGNRGLVKPLYGATRQEAKEYFRAAKERGEVQVLGEGGRPLQEKGPSKGERVVRIDGSLKGSRATSSAVILSGAGGTPIAQGEIYLRHADSSTEAEMRALLLGLLLLEPGEKATVWCDLEMLERHWRRGDGPPLLRAAKALAEALGLEVTVKKVPRSAVQAAHEGAAQARREGEDAMDAVRVLEGVLRRLPPNYRHSALGYLSHGAKRGLEAEAFRRFLEARETETARLLLREAGDSRRLETLLKAAGSVNGHGEALIRALQERDRERAMAAKPPSERQLALLRSLGYTGEPPASMLEASRTIEALLKRR